MSILDDLANTVVNAVKSATQQQINNVEWKISSGIQNAVNKTVQQGGEKIEGTLKNMVHKPETENKSEAEQKK